MHRFQDAEVDADHDRIISRFDLLCTEARRDGRALPGLHAGEHEGGRRASEASARSPLVDIGRGDVGPEALPALVRELHHYLTDHFRREEALMAVRGYPDLGGHRQAHAAMRFEFEQTLEPQLLGGPQQGPVLRDDVRLLRDMFLAHIVTWDDVFGGWLEARQLPAARPGGVSTLSEGAMRITIDSRQDITIICPEGKITLGDGDQELGEAVRTQLEQGARKILVDFSHVTYLDSSGLGELVGCYTSIRTRGGDLKICGVNSRVFNLMKLTSLHSVFDVRDTEEQALAAF